MKIKILIVLVVGFFVGSPFSTAHAVDLTLDNASALVYFSPHDECVPVLVKEIGAAKTKILIQAYTFNSAEISAAVIRAHQRGVPVEIILDKSNRWEKSSTGALVAQAGIPTYIDARHVIANNKVMIIDQGTVITGSFNYSEAAAKKNAENLLIIRDRKLAAIYLDNWEKHREHAVPYKTDSRGNAN